MSGRRREKTLAVALFSMSLWFSAAGVRAAMVSLPENASIGAGETQTTVVLTIDDAAGVLAGAFHLTFDPSVVRSAAVEPGPLLEGCTILSNEQAPGELRLAFACTSELAGGGTLFRLTFERAASGETPLAFAESGGCELNEGDPPCTTRNGHLVVEGSTGTPPPTTPAVTPSPPPACPGDCDGNGRVTVDELILAVNAALGRTTVSTCSAADRNANGEITVDELIAAVRAGLAGCAAAG